MALFEHIVGLIMCLYGLGLVRYATVCPPEIRPAQDMKKLMEEGLVMPGR